MLRHEQQSAMPTTPSPALSPRPSVAASIRTLVKVTVREMVLRKIQAPIDLVSSRPGFDWLFTLVVLLLLLVVQPSWTNPLATMVVGDRRSLYQTLAGISGALLGFAIAAVSILLGLGNGRRLNFIQGSRWVNSIPKTFTGAIRALAIATAVFVFALTFDSTEACAVTEITGTCGTASPWHLIVTGAAVLTLFRVSRLVWLLHRLVSLAYSDQATAQ